MPSGPARSHTGYGAAVYGWGRGSEVSRPAWEGLLLNAKAWGVAYPFEVKFFRAFLIFSLGAFSLIRFGTRSCRNSICSPFAPSRMTPPEAGSPADRAGEGNWKGTRSLIILTAWWLWRLRSDCIFNGATPEVHTLVEAILAEANL